MDECPHCSTPVLGFRGGCLLSSALESRDEGALVDFGVQGLVDGPAIDGSGTMTVERTKNNDV
jgi:hypothetical protein